MRRAAIPAACFAVAVALLLPAAAGAATPGSFQHGGRAAGQAGAFTARAADPSAVTYNPAAITRLDGLQLQAGLDLSAPRDDYRSASGAFAANHIIEFAPAVYLSWRRPGGASPLAYGLGIDAPAWYQTDWSHPALFPGRFLTRHAALRVLALHPVVAYAIDERWSVGGGLRYARGKLEQGGNALVAGGLDPTVFPVEAIWDADTQVDGYGFDLAAHFATDVWGFGVVARSALELSGGEGVDVALRDSAPAALQATVDANLARLRRLPAPDSFELAPELVAGVWLAPYPELRLEFDVAWAGWSRVDNDQLLLPEGAAEATPFLRDRDWEDTLSLRLGVEGDLVYGWTASGGVALEPSPVSGGTLEPGFPRGDALVLALGLGYDFPQVSLDLGYSVHEHDDRSASGQEPRAPQVSGRYSTRDQVFAVSGRWRF